MQHQDKNPDKNQHRNPKPSARDNGGTSDDSGAAAKTPSTDMQTEDAGTPESGNSGRGSAVESAMKQTSKTPAERGDS
jgi:hypothetical protein